MAVIPNFEHQMEQGLPYIPSHTLSDSVCCNPPRASFFFFHPDKGNFIATLSANTTTQNELINCGYVESVVVLQLLCRIQCILDSWQLLAYKGA